MGRISKIFVGRISVIILLLIAAPNMYAQTSEIEDSLLDIKIGSDIGVLDKKYPGLYKHVLVLGEILYEACNQKDLEVFTFVEEPWSLGHITYISVRKENNVSVCRDAEGTLPDLNINPITLGDIKLGDEEQKVLDKYGTPTESHEVKGKKILRYSLNPSKKDILVSKGFFHFTISNNRVIAFSLEGDMPGVNKPQ